jgi:hypothetical protein
MNGKRSTMIVGLLICLMAGQIAYAYADDIIPHLEVNVTNTTFSAGTHGVIGITIHNGGNYDASEVEAFITSTTPGISILTGSQKVINVLSQGGSTSYNATVMIDQSVGLGAYTLAMQLTYLRAGRGIVTVPIMITIVVDKLFLPMIEVTASPKKLNVGELNVVTLTISNIAAMDVEGVALTLSTASPFLSLEGPLNYNTTIIKAGSTTSFTTRVYALESTPLGPYALAASMFYSDPSNDSFKQAATLPLEVTDPMINNIPVLTVTNLNTTTAIPGQRFTIQARVDCADASALNTKATITLDATGLLRPLTPTTISLGEMNPGDSQTVSCTVLVDGAAPAAQIPATIALAYTDSKGVQRTTVETLTVQVGQVVNFAIMNPTQVSADQGTQAKIDSSLLLKGTSKVQFTTIDVVGDSTVTIIPESSYYIGAIYPDSPVLFTLKFNILSNATLGNANVKIRVSYLDNLNRPQQQMLSYSVTVTKPAATIGNDFWGWLRHLLGMG